MNHEELRAQIEDFLRSFPALTAPFSTAHALMLEVIQPALGRYERFIADTTILAGSLAEIAASGCQTDRELAGAALAKFEHARAQEVA